jgi:hypothetical protein
MKTMNTVGYLTISKKMPMYKKTPIKKITQNIYSINNYASSDINNISKNNYKLLSRVFSKNKFRGVLDTTSPNNKDIFIDSDSERPTNKISKNAEKYNNNANRSGCAKLVIEKIESQEPTYNNEYYKFTNQRPKFNSINTNNIYKKTFNNRSYNKENSKNQRENSSNNYLIQQNNRNNQIYSYYQKLNNGTLKRSNKHTSTNNIYEKNSNLYNSINNFYEPDYFFKTQIGFNKAGKKTDISPLSKSPYYMKTSNDTFQKDSSLGKNFIIYESDSNGFSTHNQEFQNQKNLNNTQFQYIYNNNTDIKKPKCKNDEPKKHSLYENYKDLIKMSSFKKLSKSNSCTENIINTYPRNKDKIIKIQSRWRGAYVRELMAFYWNLNKFKNLIYKVMKYHIHYYFIFFKDSLKNSNKNVVKKNSKIIINKRYKSLYDKENSKIKEKESKLVEEYKQALRQKEEDYENLLKNYNSIVERCTELQQIVNEINSKNNKNVIWKELNLDSKNINNKMNVKDINQKDNKNNNETKKFDVIKPEQKETFNIIYENDNIKGLKLKAYKERNKSLLIEKQIELLIENCLNLRYQDYLNHFISNIKSINNQQILIEKNKNNKNNKIPYNIINFQLSLINNKIKKPQIIEVCQLEPLNLTNIEKENATKVTLKEVCHNEPISLINNKIKPKLFDIISINKGDNNEITILSNLEKTKDKNDGKKKYELVSEKQLNLKLEIKGLEHPKVKIFKDCIINKHINNINIIQIKKQNKFDKKLISVNNIINMSISKENGKEKEKEDLNKEKINKVIIEQFMIEKISKNEDKNKIKNYQERNIIICENERFCLIKLSEDNNKINKDKNKNVELIIEKKDNILLVENKKNKNTKLDIEFIIVNNDTLFIQKIKKKQCDKITEITEELNKIEPNNHYELIFEGLINLNEDFNKKENNLINSNKNENIIDSNKQEFSFIKKESNDKKQDINNINAPNKNINYNLTNEIEKENGLEINPLEIKKTKNNANNIFISYENKLEVLYNPNAIFTEKAKRNMMKIILPIRLKTTLREFIHRSIFPLLINNLKKIALASHSKKGDDKNIIESKKEKNNGDKIIENKKEKDDDKNIIESKKEKDDRDKINENKKEKDDDKNITESKKEKNDGDKINENKKEKGDNNNIIESKKEKDDGDKINENKKEKDDDKNKVESKKEKEDGDKIIENKKEKGDDKNIIESKKEKDDIDKKIENEKEKGDDKNIIESKKEKSEHDNGIGDNIIELRREEAEKRRSLKSSFYKSYCSKQLKKKEIKNILAEYAVYKWNKSLHGLAKEINSNKRLVLEKIKK